MEFYEDDDYGYDPVVSNTTLVPKKKALVQTYGPWLWSKTVSEVPIHSEEEADEILTLSCGHRTCLCCAHRLYHFRCPDRSCGAVQQPETLYLTSNMAIRPERPAKFVGTSLEFVMRDTSVHQSHIWLYGRMLTGESVAVKVARLKSYFWISFGGMTRDTADALILAVNDILSTKLEGALRPVANGHKTDFSLKKKALLVKDAPWIINPKHRPEPSGSIREYRETLVDSMHLKIEVAMPCLLSDARYLFEERQTAVSQRLEAITGGPITVFEADLPVDLRFMIDRGIQGASWVKVNGTPIPGHPYRDGTSRESIAYYEFHVDADSVEASEIKMSVMPPPVSASIDIEVDINPLGIGFNSSQTEAILQIAVYVSCNGKSRGFVHMQGSYEPRENFEVRPDPSVEAPPVYYCYASETELLIGFFAHMRRIDPDDILTYNGDNFDWPFINVRAELCNLTSKQKATGRLARVPLSVRESMYASSAFSSQRSVVTMHGWVSIDLYQRLLQEHKLRSYTLNSVANEFLNQSKVDLKYSDIPVFMREATGRWWLAVYCLADVRLPYLLYKKLHMDVNYIQQAHVAHVTPRMYLGRGQSIRILTSIIFYVSKHKMGIHFPTAPSDRGKPSGEPEEKYQGATVCDQASGYYGPDAPVAVLDFESLYPSIMQEANLCYTTAISLAEIKRLGYVKGEDYTQLTPTSACFVTTKHRKGILPLILEYWRSARKEAKGHKATHLYSDPELAAIYDALQLGFKIQMNSVYGVTGARFGSLSMKQIAFSTTEYGRAMIAILVEFVTTTYTRKNGYPFDIVVVYGDTDSIFIVFRNCTKDLYLEGTDKLDINKIIDESIKISKRATETLYKAPHNLQFEKVFSGLILVSKKRYAGLKIVLKKHNGYGNIHSIHTFMDASGMENVRRDPCRLVGEIVTEILRLVIEEQSVQKAVDYAQDIIRKLLVGEVPIHSLILSRKLSRKIEDYKNRPPHVYLCERIQERNPDKTPKVGERVEYVIIDDPRKRLKTMRAEDPMFVLENDIPVDYGYYFANQILKPMARLFYYILSNPEDQRKLTNTSGILWMRTLPGIKPKTLFDAENDDDSGSDTEGVLVDMNEAMDKLSIIAPAGKPLLTKRPLYEEVPTEEAAPKRPKTQATMNNYFGGCAPPVKVVKPLNNQQAISKMIKSSQMQAITGAGVTKKRKVDVGYEGSAIQDLYKRKQTTDDKRVLVVPRCIVCRASTEDVGFICCPECRSGGETDPMKEARASKKAEVLERVAELEDTKQKCIVTCTACVAINPLIDMDTCNNTACSTFWQRVEDKKRTSKAIRLRDLQW